MNLPFLISGILAAIGALIHGFGGEHTDILHLREIDMPQLEKLELRGSWHFFTVDLSISAVALLIMSFPSFFEAPAIIAMFISLHFFAYALLWGVMVAVNRFSNLIRLPQWILLLAIAVFSLWGTV